MLSPLLLRLMGEWASLTLSPEELFYKTNLIYEATMRYLQIPTFKILNFGELLDAMMD